MTSWMRGMTGVMPVVAALAALWPALIPALARGAPTAHAQHPVAALAAESPPRTTLRQPVHRAAGPVRAVESRAPGATHQIGGAAGPIVDAARRELASAGSIAGEPTHAVHPILAHVRHLARQEIAQARQTVAPTIAHAQRAVSPVVRRLHQTASALLPTEVLVHAASRAVSAPSDVRPPASPVQPVQPVQLSSLHVRPPLPPPSDTGVAPVINSTINLADSAFQSLRQTAPSLLAQVVHVAVKLTGQISPPLASVLSRLTVPGLLGGRAPQQPLALRFGTLRFGPLRAVTLPAAAASASGRSAAVAPAHVAPQVASPAPPAVAANRSRVASAGAGTLRSSRMDALAPGGSPVHGNGVAAGPDCGLPSTGAVRPR